MAIKHIVLDVWQTILKSNPEYGRARIEAILNTFAKEGDCLTIDSLTLAMKECKAMLDAYEVTGNTIPYDFKQITLAKQMNLPIEVTTDPRWHAIFNELVMQHKPLLYFSGIADLINEWRGSGITVSILSNTHFIKGEVITKVLTSYGITVDWYYFSDQRRLCKPNASLFEQQTLKREVEFDDSGLITYAPNEVMMIGDSILLDIAPASKAGFDIWQIISENDWLSIKGLKLHEQNSST